MVWVVAKAFSSCELCDAHGLQQGLAFAVFRIWLCGCEGAVVLRSSCRFTPRHFPDVMLLHATVGRKVVALAGSALLLASPFCIFKNCLEQSGFLLGPSCVSYSCLHRWLWSGFFSVSHLCLGIELSLLLFHLHTFHLVPHFWMVREVCGRKRLRGSKTPRVLWSRGTLTNARGQKGWKRVQLGVTAQRGKGTGFCHWVGEQCWRDVLSVLSFSWGSRMWNRWLTALLHAKCCPALNKLETREKRKKSE